MREDASDGSDSHSVSDALGHNVLNGATNLFGQWVYTSREYDALGRKTRESEPYLVSDGVSLWKDMVYDEYNRVIETTLPTGRVTQVSYHGNTVEQDDGIKTTSITRNALGEVVLHTDLGGSIAYHYNAHGQLVQAQYEGLTVDAEWDGWGNRIALHDPSAGTYQRLYNAYGELLSETTPSSTTTYTYNAIGDVISKVSVGDNTDWSANYTYDPDTALLLQVDSADHGETSSIAYTYDMFRRVLTTQESTDDVHFEHHLTYDLWGRLDTETFSAHHFATATSASHAITHAYQHGEPWRIVDANDPGQELWRVDAVNAQGHVTQGTLGSGVVFHNSYDALGLLTEQRVDPTDGADLVLGYSFEPIRGNLLARSNSALSIAETFTYDSWDRLISVDNGQDTWVQSYDDWGRIAYNQGVGSYNYAAD
ncbi:MAG: hypothetical protein AAFX99_36480, partial [Myxococcota bacterium]